MRATADKILSRGPAAYALVALAAVLLAIGAWSGRDVGFGTERAERMLASEDVGDVRKTIIRDNLERHREDTRTDGPQDAVVPALVGAVVLGIGVSEVRRERRRRREDEELEEAGALLEEAAALLELRRERDTRELRDALAAGLRLADISEARVFEERRRLGVEPDGLEPDLALEHELAGAIARIEEWSGPGREVWAPELLVAASATTARLEVHRELWADPAAARRPGNFS